MKAVDSAIGKIGRIMMGGWSHGCGQYEAVLHTDRCVFFESVMRLIILHYPV